MSGEISKVTITHFDAQFTSGTGGKYVAEIAGEKASGYLEWEPHRTSDEASPDEASSDEVGHDETGEVRIATHTVVPPEIGGRGIAGMLVNQLVADARDQGFKIVPQCSYVEAKFAANPDWADVRG